MSYSGNPYNELTAATEATTLVDQHTQPVLGSDAYAPPDSSQQQTTLSAEDEHNALYRVLWELGQQVTTLTHSQSTIQSALESIAQ